MGGDVVQIIGMLSWHAALYQNAKIMSFVGVNSWANDIQDLGWKKSLKKWEESQKIAISLDQTINL